MQCIKILLFVGRLVCRLRNSMKKRHGLSFCLVLVLEVLGSISHLRILSLFMTVTGYDMILSLFITPYL